MSVIYRLKQLILVLGDLGSFLIGLWLSILIRNLRLPAWNDLEKNLSLFLVVFSIWLIINYINGLYDLVRVRKDVQSYKRLIETCVVAFIVGIIFFYLLPNQTIAPKTILLLNVIIGYSLSAFWRFIYNLIIGKHRLQTNVLFLGYTQETQELIDILKNQPEKGYKTTSLIISSEENKKDINIKDVEIYNNIKTLRPAITNHHVQLIVIAPHLKKDKEVLRELYELLFWPVQMTDITSFYELITGRIPPCTFSESWFLEHLKNTDQPIYDKFRAIVDYITGIIMVIIFSILFIPIAIAIKLNSEGPIFFHQKRIGKDKKVFVIHKFRSMNTETDKEEDDDKKTKRITSVGKILRKTRIDELPQFINLFRRDISLIGPRPEMPSIVKNLEEKILYYPLRHIIRPGLTGWAVIHQGHTNTTAEECLEKLQYDLYYIKNRSFLLDLSILLRTVNIVLRMMGR